MKRTGSVCLLTLLAAAAIPVIANASELRLGALAGANSAAVSVTDAEPWGQYSAHTRPIFGAMLELKLGPSFSVAVEPSFVGKGAKYVEGGQELRTNLDYVELPLYAKYRLTQGSVRPYVGAGPYLGLAVRAKSNGEDVKDQMKDTDAGVAFGGGVELVSGNTAFFVDGRYALGLSNLSKSLDDPETKARNRGLQVRAGVTFRLGGS